MISLRLPSGLLSDLKALANERDVPYQSLLDKEGTAKAPFADGSRLIARPSPG